MSYRSLHQTSQQNTPLVHRYRMPALKCGIVRPSSAYPMIWLAMFHWCVPGIVFRSLYTFRQETGRDMPTTNHIPEFRFDPLARLPEALRSLARDKDVLREYNAGDLIIGPDHGSGRICFLVSGEAGLVLRDDDKERLAVDSLGAGDIFGEISFFTGIPWPSDAELVADEPCRVLEIPPEDFERMMRGEPDFAVTMVKNLRSQDNATRPHYLERQTQKTGPPGFLSAERSIFSPITSWEITFGTVCLHESQSWRSRTVRF